MISKNKISLQQKNNTLLSDETIINRGYNFVGLLISAISLIIFILIIFDENKYKSIFLYIHFIPLMYSIFNLLFINVYSKLSVGRIIVLVLMFIRYCLTPLIIYREGYPTGIYNLVESSEIALFSTFLMCYEMLIIFIVLNHIGRKKAGFKDEVTVKDIVCKNNFSKLNIFVMLLILLTIFIYIIFPSLFSNYYFIFTSGANKVSEIELSQSNLPFGMGWIGFTLGEVTRYVLISWVILNIFQRSQRFGHKRFYCLLSLGIIMGNAMFITSRQMLDLMITVAFCTLVLKLYPSERRNLYKLFILGGSLIFVEFLLKYWETSLTYQSFAAMIQGYTNGFYNVYQSNYAYQEYGHNFGHKYLMFIFGDTLMSVNVLNYFLNRIFTFDTSSNILNYFLYGPHINGGQVVTMLSQCNYYFSFLLAPIGSAISILLMDHFEKKALQKGNSFIAVKFFAFIFALAPFMYNYTTLIHICTLLYLPLYFISKLNCLRIS